MGARAKKKKNTAILAGERDTATEILPENQPHPPVRRT
jgi:hypothetical protein